MKKLLIWITGILLGVIVIDLSFGSIIQYFQEKSNELSPQRNKLYYNVERDSSELIILGASDAAHHYDSHLIGDSLGISVYNCGIDGCFLSYQICELELILKRRQPKVIVWQFGPEYLSNYYDDLYDYQSIRDLYLYYNDSYVKKVIDKKNWYQKYLMLSKLYRCNNQLYNIFAGFLLHNNNEIDRGGYEPLVDKGDGYPVLSHEDNGGDISEDKCQMFIEAIRKIESKNIKLVLVTAPMYNDYPVENTEYYRRLLSILEEHNIPYINYRHNPFFMSDNTLYKDYGHLNEKGAREYMKRFVPDLKKVIDNF